jgi:4-cresol dehydrogenase (hydroxylating)
MDDVADSYDFNHNALRKLNERMKDALDPNGILAPGRNGIWPKAYRDQRGKL